MRGELFAEFSRNFRGVFAEFLRSFSGENVLSLYHAILRNFLFKDFRSFFVCITHC